MDSVLVLSEFGKFELLLLKILRLLIMIKGKGGKDGKSVKLLMTGHFDCDKGKNKTIISSIFHHKKRIYKRQFID